MRIQVRRTGGFAGIERYAEIDTAGRPDATEWQVLAERALATGQGTRPAGVPDGFHYEVTVDDRTVHASDPGVPDDLRALVTRVLKEGA